MRVPSGEPELVRAGAAGDPAALAALWDAYGGRVFAFCQRVIGRADAAADAAQDAFLLAHAELGSLAHAGESFGGAVFAAARTTSFELVARDRAAGGARRGPAPSLSAAAVRLRPQQRAALALSGLERLRYAEIAAVLGVGAEAVGALLARARLRLRDELHGTALAAAAVRSPDCEDVIPLLAAASDGELAAADAGWADPHVESCPTCPRTRRAMDEAAATYAAWSPAPPPSWLREATLTELGAQAPAAAALAATAGPLALTGAGGNASGAAAASGAAGGAWTTPRPRLSAALLGASLLAVAGAALALTGSLRQRDALSGGVRLPDAAESLRVAGVPAAPAKHRARAQQRAPRRARSTRHPRVAFVPVRALHRVPSPSLPSATRGVTGTAPRPTARPKRRPGSRPPAAPAPAPAPPAPVAPAPVTADAPADASPATSPSTAGAAPATTAQVPAAVTPPTTTTAAQAPAPSIPAAQPAASEHDRWSGPGSDQDHGGRPAGDQDGGSGSGSDQDHGGRPAGDQDGGSGWHKSRRPCPPTQRGPRRSSRH